MQCRLSFGEASAPKTQKLLGKEGRGGERNPLKNPVTRHVKTSICVHKCRQEDGGRFWEGPAQRHTRAQICVAACVNVEEGKQEQRRFVLT